MYISTMKYENNNAQICFTDNSGSHQKKLNAIREHWIKENPHNLDVGQLWEVQKAKGISGTLRLMIDLEFEKIPK